MWLFFHIIRKKNYEFMYKYFFCVFAICQCFLLTLLLSFCIKNVIIALIILCQVFNTSSMLKSLRFVFWILWHVKTLRQIHNNFRKCFVFWCIKNVLSFFSTFTDAATAKNLVFYLILMKTIRLWLTKLSHERIFDSTKMYWY